MPEESIKFDSRVDDVYPFGVPLVVQPMERRNDYLSILRSVGVEVDEDSKSFPDEAESTTRKLIHREIMGTARSIRRENGPETVLHALLLDDRLTLGQLAGMTHQDPRDLELPLGALVSFGWVRTEDDDGLRRYSLTER